MSVLSRTEFMLYIVIFCAIFVAHNWILALLFYFIDLYQINSIQRALQFYAKSKINRWHSTLYEYCEAQQKVYVFFVGVVLC
jgi:hypothetical protein